ncbi:MAG: hypothetical protein RL722_16 [Pseudomonadota bacterium]
MALIVAVGFHRHRPADLAHQVRQDFIRFSGLTDDLSALTPEQALDHMTRFRRNFPYEVELLTPYGDALLFESGIYDWGQGEHFELRITRQVVFPFRNPLDADDHIIQISLQFLYRPDGFRQMPFITRWEDSSSGAQGLRDFAQATPAFRIASSTPPYAVRLESSRQ